MFSDGKSAISLPVDNSYKDVFLDDRLMPDVLFPLELL
jgi:hypothetical protein